MRNIHHPQPRDLDSLLQSVLSSLGDDEPSNNTTREMPVDREAGRVAHQDPERSSSMIDRFLDTITEQPFPNEFEEKTWNVVVQKTRRSKRKAVSVGLTYDEATKALDQLRGQAYDNKIYDCGIYRREGVQINASR